MDKVPVENSWQLNSANNTYVNIAQRQDSTSSGYLEPQPQCSNTDHSEPMAETIKDEYLSMLHATEHYELINSQYDDEFGPSSHIYEPLKSAYKPRIKDLTGQKVKLREIPPDVVRNENIWMLILDCNEFLELPSELFKMVNIMYLSVASQICPKRASFSQWPALGHIPKEIGKLKKLAHLFLCNNALVELPSSMGSLNHLMYIDLKLNWLRKFPPCLCEIKTLQELHLSGNYIEVIPKEIQKLINIRVFRIGKNQLKSVPKEISTLKMLTCLSLRNNQIEELPSDIYELKGLLPQGSKKEVRLHLDGNPLRYPPLEVVSKGTSAVFEHLKLTIASHKTQEKAEVNGSAAAEVLWSRKPPTKSMKRPTDLEFETSQKRLEKAVKENGLILRNPTPRDGNCFFHAVSDQLQRPGMQSKLYDHKELRQRLVQYLDAGSDEKICQWIKDTSGKSLDHYVQSISNDGTWADEIAVAAMAKVLQRNIRVLPSSPVQMQANRASFMGYMYCGGNGQGKELLLGHQHELHYQSLGSHEDMSSHEIKLGPFNSSEMSFKDTPPQILEDYLDLSNKQLDKLPLEIAEQENISTLILDNNCLLDSQWISVARKLKQLEKVSLKKQDEALKGSQTGYSVLRTIPPEIHLLFNLTHLCMAKNKIRAIPVELTYLEGLKMLDLINNNIKVIPDEIENLKELEYLGLSNNNIASIPKSIGCLTKLKVFRLSDNELQELPDEICLLEDLFVFSVSKNRLKYLPPELHRLTEVTSKSVYECDIIMESATFRAGLRMEGNNDIIFPPKLICDEGLDSIFSYLGTMEMKLTARNQLLKEAKSLIQQQLPTPVMEDKPFTQQPLPSPVSMIDSPKYQHLTTTFLNRLADKIGREWKDVGAQLEVEKAKIDHCEIDNRGDIKAAICKMFETWRDHNIGQNNTEDDLLKKLIYALGEAGRNDLKDKLLKQYRRISNAQL